MRRMPCGVCSSRRGSNRMAGSPLAGRPTVAGTTRRTANPAATPQANSNSATVPGRDASQVATHVAASLATLALRRLAVPPLWSTSMGSCPLAAIQPSGDHLSLGGMVSPGHTRRNTMCALVMNSNTVALPKARNWGLVDQLRWKIECLVQRLKGEV